MLKKFLSVLRGVKEPVRPIRPQAEAFFSNDEVELDPIVPIAVVREKEVIDVSVPIAREKEIEKLSSQEKSTIWSAFIGEPEVIEYDFDEGLGFDIEYKDSKGKVTERSIECYGFTQNANSEVMNAHCYVRERMRTFRVDRIVTASNSFTGLVYEDLDAWLDQLRVYFESKKKVKPASEHVTYNQPLDDMGWIEADDKRSVAKLMRRCEDGLRVLFYFARCDGDYHIAEYLVIDDYIEEMNCLDGEGNFLVVDTGLVMDWAESLRVTYRDAEKALRNLDNRGELQGLLRVVKKVIDADGVLHPKEHEAYLELLG